MMEASTRRDHEVCTLFSVCDGVAVHDRSGARLRSAWYVIQRETGPTVQPFRLFNPDTMAKPTAGYSQVAEVNGGKIVYIAGQVALDRSGNLVGKDDFSAQVQQVFENLKAAV